MQSNPYEPLTTQRLHEQTVEMPLNWRIILIAIVICFGVGCVVGIGWGVMGLILAFAAGPAITSYFDGPILSVAGCIIGLIPSVAGAFYLGRRIESRWLGHALIYSLANLLITFLFMLFPFESGITWTDIVYSALLVPLEIACVSFARRSR